MSGPGTQDVSDTMTDTLVDKKPRSEVGIKEFDLEFENLKLKSEVKPLNVREFMFVDL